MYTSNACVRMLRFEQCTKHQDCAQNVAVSNLDTYIMCVWLLFCQSSHHLHPSCIYVLACCHKHAAHSIQKRLDHSTHQTINPLFRPTWTMQTHVGPIHATRTYVRPLRANSVPTQHHVSITNYTQQPRQPLRSRITLFQRPARRKTVSASMHGHSDGLVSGLVNTAIKPALLTLQSNLNKTYSTLLPGPARFAPTFLLPISALIAALGAAYGTVAWQRLLLLLADLSTHVCIGGTYGDKCSIESTCSVGTTPHRTHPYIPLNTPPCPSQHTVWCASAHNPHPAVPTRRAGSPGGALPLWWDFCICTHASARHHTGQ